MLTPVSDTKMSGQFFNVYTLRPVDERRKQTSETTRNPMESDNRGQADLRLVLGLFVLLIISPMLITVGGEFFTAFDRSPLFSTGQAAFIGVAMVAAIVAAIFQK